MATQMADDEEIVSIVKCTHPVTVTGHIIYLPSGQAQPDTLSTLCRDNLVERKEGSTITADVRTVRMLCWMMTRNADAKRLGKEEIFKDLPADLIEDISSSNN